MNNQDKNKQWLFIQAPGAIEKIPEGFLLKEMAQTKKKRSLIGSIVIFLMIGVFILVFWWFLLIVAVIGGIIAWSIPATRNYILAYFRLFPGELILSNYPLNLGNEYVFTFRRRLKKNRKTKDSGQLTLKVYCVERVSYRKGSDTETEISIIWESEAFTYSLAAGIDTLSCRTNVTIPKHLPPSYEGRNNQIRWVASIEQSVSNLANNVCSNFTFIVDPVVAL